MGRFFRGIGHVLSTVPSLTRFVFSSSIGSDYGVGPIRKARLIFEIHANKRRVETLSDGLEHLEMAEHLLSLPKRVPGDVIECGCYKGGSTANLSLVCSMVGRRLLVFDSFRGLPDPSADEREHYCPFSGDTDVYEEGSFAASLDDVRRNVERYGDLASCEFVTGFFEDTLPSLDRTIVMAFLDVDLIESLKPCLTGIWPNLANGCRVYVHEARSLTLVSLFFDSAWWGGHIGQAAPGFVGAGTGLPLRGRRGSQLGYAQKGRGWE